MEKVSVIIPAYNRSDLTVKTVKSVLAQTYNDVEVIVVDDGSTDDTRQKLLVFRDRIKYVFKQNGGACSARNLGIRLSTGRYIALLDCDDIYLPEKLDKSVAYLRKNRDFGLVHTSAYFIDENGNYIRRYPFFFTSPSGWISDRLVKKNFICNSTLVLRRECFERVGYFDESIFMPADWDMWLRLSEFYKCGYINQPLTLYRSSQSYVLANLERLKEECFVVLEKTFKRRSGLNRAQLLSNVYCWQALGYLKINEAEKAKKELSLALEKYTFNLQARCILILVKLFGKKLFKVLNRFKVI